MVTTESVQAQLKRIGFAQTRWGRAEVAELPHILLPDEEIYECVNGIYEAGFALLVATNFRVILIDKKPLNYLTVEDLRFDMINEIDFSHRLWRAYITISTGSKTLRFYSYNQPRLRKLINHVQHCMADTKKQQSEHQEGQNQHLENINQQLQTYLLAQFSNQQELYRQLSDAQQRGLAGPVPTIAQPSPELTDYLLSQRLLQDQQQTVGAVPVAPVAATPPTDSVRSQDQLIPLPPTPQAPMPTPASPSLTELYAEGMQEVFGKHATDSTATTPPPQPTPTGPVATAGTQPTGYATTGLEVNPLRIAYSKLPMALRNRRFGRPSFHAHSQAKPPAAPQQPAPVRNS